MLVADLKKTKEFIQWQADIRKIAAIKIQIADLTSELLVIEKINHYNYQDLRILRDK
jgi:hypothetical protein